MRMALQNRESNHLEAGEEVADSKAAVSGASERGCSCCQCWCRDRGGWCRGRLSWISGAHGVAPFEDGAFGFETRAKILPELMKSVSSAKKGARVDGVEAAGFFFGETHGFDGDNLEAGFVNARKNFALLTATDSVGFDDCESAFESHNDLLRKVK